MPKEAAPAWGAGQDGRQSILGFHPHSILKSDTSAYFGATMIAIGAGKHVFTRAG